MPLQGQQQPQPLLVPKKGLQPLPIATPHSDLGQRTLANILTPKGISDFVDEARAKKENHGRPCFSLCFGIAGRRDELKYKPLSRLIEKHKVHP